MSKIVSVHSYRGGTGKSNTTANLAVSIAAQGCRVGIVDTDIQSPGIHALFDFDENNIKLTLNDFLWGRCSITEAACNVSWVIHDLGMTQGEIYLVPSSVKAGDIAEILRQGYDVGMLREGFQDLIDDLSLDYLLIDTHPGLNEETLLSIAISDVAVLVLRPDKQDYQGTAITVDVARKLGVEKLLLVANKAPCILDFDELKDQLEKTYNSTVAGILPHSDDMMFLASNGVFAIKFPDHPYTNIIRDITAKIMA
ncbi:MAG: MinD/ParA family protein [Leptolyngbya sp.]|nr:MinD/ParA family protein [Leptolyngbya sp.]